MPTIQDSRILIKSSTVTGVEPTVPDTNDHTDGTWAITDIYKGEIFINQADGKVFTRVDSGIIELTGAPAEYDFIIIRSTGPDGHRWKMTVGDDGVWQSEDLGV